MSQLGGLAALAGVTSSGGSRAEALATLQSDLLTQRYIREQNLLPILYSRRWDATKRVWKVADTKQVPTVWQANERFADIRTVSDDKKTGLIIVAVTWSDRELAAKWANDLVDLTNNYMRQKAIEQAESNMAYLRDQVEKTNILEMRGIIYSLMQNELKNAMMARGTQEFAIQGDRSCDSTGEPSSPKPSSGPWADS